MYGPGRILICPAPNGLFGLCEFPAGSARAGKAPEEEQCSPSAGRTFTPKRVAAQSVSWNPRPQNLWNN